jgi:hypothetical protein
VMNDAVKVINEICSLAGNSRLFTTKCERMNSLYQQVLLQAKARCYRKEKFLYACLN